MKEPTLQTACLAAEQAVRVAGEYLLSEFQKHHEVELEGTHEKIASDVIAETVILDELRKHLSQFSYISEETQHTERSPLTFIIDPLEGTSNFLRSVPFFATQIAIVFEEELVAGFVYEPIRRTLYSAQRAQGFFVNDRKVVLTQDRPLKESVVTFGSGSKHEEKVYINNKVIAPMLPLIRSFRIYGATGLELAKTAQGIFQGHLNYHSKVYDYAAGVMLIREAGGEVLNFEGKPWTLADTTLMAFHPNNREKCMNALKT